MIGVIACPITSGDTAFRSARLTISDWFKNRPERHEEAAGFIRAAAGCRLLYLHAGLPSGLEILLLGKPDFSDDRSSGGAGFSVGVSPKNASLMAAIPSLHVCSQHDLHPLRTGRAQSGCQRLYHPDLCHRPDIRILILASIYIVRVYIPAGKNDRRLDHHTA